MKVKKNENENKKTRMEKKNQENVTPKSHRTNPFCLTCSHERPY